jgi:hypothetical protein
MVDINQYGTDDASFQAAGNAIHQGRDKQGSRLHDTVVDHGNTTCATLAAKGYYTCQRGFKLSTLCLSGSK